MGFVGNSPVKLSDVLGLKWKSLQNGKNHYRATSDEDTLGSLAYKVSGYKEDWSCLWPVSPLEEIRDRYPQSSDGKVKKCDVYDISNLVKSTEEGERLGIYLDPTRHNVAQAAFSGSIYIDGGDVAQKIQSVSKEGKTPIGQFFLYGHCNSGLEYMSGNHGGNDFKLTSLLNKNELPSFDRAVQMKGPLRCWFCIKTKARIQDCTTAHMAEQIAEHVFRKGSFVTGTNQTTGLRINNNVLEMGYNVRHNPTTGYDELINWGGYDNSNILVTYNGKL